MKSPRAPDVRTPVVIAAAPTGAHKTRADFPNLPVDIEQIADEAAACAAAGASMLHLHVRDGDGRHSLDAQLYRRAVDAIRARCGDALVLQLTSEQAGVYDTRAQLAAIESMQADFLSIALREVIGDQSDEELARARRLFDELGTRGTSVQIILYSSEQLELLRRLVSAGVIPDRRMPLLFVLGRYHSEQQSSPEDLLPFLQSPLERDPWMVCAFGVREQECMRFAAVRGGHLRLGFENNTLKPDGGALRSTAESVAMAAAMLREEGLEIADAAAARCLLLGQESPCIDPSTDW